MQGQVSAVNIGTRCPFEFSIAGTKLPLELYAAGTIDPFELATTGCICPLLKITCEITGAV
jgi:hypothetical protein